MAPGQSLKDEIRALMAEREAIEAEIEERTARLNAPGQPGMEDALVDAEVRVRRISRGAAPHASRPHPAHPPPPPPPP